MNSLERDALLPFILAVLKTGKPWESKMLHFPAEGIIEAVLSIPGVARALDEDDGNGEGFSTNGWQWDWWQNFTYNGKNYTLSGSGYYGGHSFNLSDE